MEQRIKQGIIASYLVSARKLNFFELWV